MVSTVKKAKTDTNKTLSEIAKKREEIDSIVKSAREAAVTAGVGHFTQDFALESEQHKTDSQFWLKVVCWLGGATLFLSLAFGGYTIFGNYDPQKFTQIITSKLTIIIILLTATLWCGKIYKSHKHISFINKHRANALKTFLAFSQATDDEQTKNAVLIEAAHCVFSASNTGFVDASDTNESIKFMEIFKNVKQG